MTAAPQHDGVAVSCPARLAVDVLGHDADPDVVLAGVLTALRADPGLSVQLVGPADHLRGKVSALAGDLSDQIGYAQAAEVVGMAEHPVRAVRARPASTVRVASELVRDGAVDAMVSVGSTGAALSAAVHTLGRTMARPALVVTVPSVHGPLTLLDVGATLEPDADVLVEHGYAGVAYARARFGERCRLGLLSVGEEAGKGDAIRRSAHDRLASSGLPFVGNVEGHDVPIGDRCEVVLCDGFTGNVLLKGMEGTVAMLRQVLGDDPALAGRLAHLSPEQSTGAVVLGVGGTVVIGHGAASAAAVERCVRLAAVTVRSAVLSTTGSAYGATGPTEGQ